MRDETLKKGDWHLFLYRQSTVLVYKLLLTLNFADSKLDVEQEWKHSCIAIFT